METPSKPQFRPPARGGENLKDQLTQILKDEDLARKLGFIKAFAAESDTDVEHVAAALLVLAERQRARPSFPARPPRKEFGQNRFREQTGYQAERRVPDSKPSFQRKEGRPSRAPAGPMTKYRIEVGRSHGLVGPGQIVGAIANESALTGADIGGIDIQTHFTTIDLPQSMSEDVLRELREIRIAGQALRLTKWERGGDRRLSEKPRQFNKKKGAKPSWKKPRKREAPPASS